MVRKTKVKSGRPLADIKIRTIKGVTPKGFRIFKIRGEIILFKKKVAKRGK